MKRLVSRQPDTQFFAGESPVSGVAAFPPPAPRSRFKARVGHASVPAPQPPSGLFWAEPSMSLCAWGAAQPSFVSFPKREVGCAANPRGVGTSKVSAQPLWAQNQDLAGSRASLPLFWVTGSRTLPKI